MNLSSLVIVGATLAGAAAIAWVYLRRGGPNAASSRGVSSDERETFSDAVADGEGIPRVDATHRHFLAFALSAAPEALALPPSADYAPVMAAASAILEAIEAQPEYIPRRPALLPQLLTAVKDDGTSIRDIARIIGQDPALTGNLLRIANSSFYRGTGKPVESIDRAAILVGTEGIRSIIATALLQPVMSTKSGAFSGFPEVIWEYTLYSATAAESYAGQVEPADPFSARLLGLLDGLATIVVFRIVRDQFTTRPELSPDAATVSYMLARHVPATAQRIAESWELSAAVRDAICSTDNEIGVPLGRALAFGKSAAALLVLCRAGRVKETAARATLLASHSRGMQIDRVWNRLVEAYVRPRG
jgi:HD-like signal output (HDOD) protein